MKRLHRILRALGAAGGILFFLHAGMAGAADEKKDLVLRGDAKCTRCHDAGDDFPVLAIGQTRHVFLNKTLRPVRLPDKYATLFEID